MELDFGKLDGLIPAVIQDHASGRVLMVGFMNEAAFRRMPPRQAARARHERLFRHTLPRKYRR